MSRDEPTDATAPTYTMGYGSEFQKMLVRRNAAINAAHLLPHLKPGMRLLDIGCGPGTISVGLAQAVAPGALHGIDMEESQIAIARAAAAAGGHDNATFQTGDSTFLEPELGGLGGDRVWGTFLWLLAVNGGHPHMGKELPRVLVDADFADIRASASFETYSSADDLAFLHDLVVG